MPSALLSLKKYDSISKLLNAAVVVLWLYCFCLQHFFGNHGMGLWRMVYLSPFLGIRPMAERGLFFDFAAHIKVHDVNDIYDIRYDLKGESVVVHPHAKNAFKPGKQRYDSVV